MPGLWSPSGYGSCLNYLKAGEPRTNSICFAAELRGGAWWAEPSEEAGLVSGLGAEQGVGPTWVFVCADSDLLTTCSLYLV